LNASVDILDTWETYLWLKLYNDVKILDKDVV
jgi:hypothetical protein